VNNRIEADYLIHDDHIMRLYDFVDAIDELGDLRKADHAELVRVLKYIRESLAPPNPRSKRPGVVLQGDAQRVPLPTLAVAGSWLLPA
jgi:hypothetical protein